MKIEKDFLEYNRFSRSGRKLIGVYGIVYHYTAGRGHTGKGIRNYFNSLKYQIGKYLQWIKKIIKKITFRYASTQLIIGLKGEVIQTMPLNELAFHVGGGRVNRKLMKRLHIKPRLRNYYFIGIELCIDKYGDFTNETLKTGIKTGIYLMKKFKLGKDRIFRHYDITRKICPKYFVDNPAEWVRFYRKIQEGI